ncbi:MAG: NfeD family protein [Bacteroidetes bacterium]|nr:NfeD family protein [Bacteroidota bacterium]
MLKFLSDPQLWLALGFILLILEVTSFSFFFLFIGAAALLTSLATWLGLLPSMAWQLVFFGVSSLILLVTLRKWLKNKFNHKAEERKGYVEFIGNPVEIIKDVPAEGEGRINYRGSEWIAISIDGVPIEKGTPAFIHHMDGIKVYVTTAKQ